MSTISLRIVGTCRASGRQCNINLINTKRSNMTASLVCDVVLYFSIVLIILNQNN